MVGQLNHRLARVGRHLPAQYLLPIAALLILAFGSLFGLLFQLTAVQDRMERDRAFELVRNATEGAKRMIEHDLRDYAMWDEAVVNLLQRYDAEWIEDNIGSYLGDTQGYDQVWAVDGSGRPIYVYRSGPDWQRLRLENVLGPSIRASMDALRTMETRGPFTSGFTRQGDTVFLFAAAAIVPLTGKVQLPEGRSGSMVIARRIDQAYVDKLVEDLNAPKLRLSKGPTPEGWDHLILKDREGRPLAKLIWSPARPGSALRRSILPAFLVVGAASLFVAGVLLQRGRRAVEALRFSETRAHHLAKHDPLTGLPNRRAMKEEVQALLESGGPVTLLYLDLDGFKETNDVYGHGAGDELLCGVASRLIEVIPNYHLVARVGGDEFAVVLSAQCEEGEAAGAAILAAFACPFTVAEYRVSLGVSIGLATDEAAHSPEEIARRADAAMYAAKAGGKHCLRAYSSAIDADREVRKLLERDLRLAIERNAIRVVFQPIVAAGSERVVAVEALARWHHPERGPISPDIFIPIAEESGLIVALGRQVLSAACSEARGWGVDLAVNLSPAQFWDRALAGTVREVLVETGFSPHRLELEITEGYLLRRPEAAGEILAQLKAMGVRIALDDFGTGFASIGYLQRLGFDSIKIDRSFVAAAAARPKAADLARAIVAMGDALDLPVTAEGVELPAQAALMRDAGCTRLQGWLFGKPMSGEEMQAWFARYDASLLRASAA